jgi:enoyl-CoA hydratase/carnithine racemase
VSFSIDTSWSGKVAVLTFRDAGRNNRICWAAVDALGATLKECREAGARAVILASGLEGHWLEHAWLVDLMSGAQGGEQTGSGAGWFTVQKELTHEDVVSIAAIAGSASGGGAEIAWACDIRIAEPQACFAQPEVNMGLTTGIGGCSRLARLAGRAAALDMVLTGSVVSAERLYDLGAITRLVPQGEALDQALTLALQLAEKSADALSGLKKILVPGCDLSLDEALRHEQSVFQSVVVTERALSDMRSVQSGYEET